MSRYLLLLLLLPLASCHNTWTTEAKNTFYRDCTTKAKTWAATTARANDYCDCVFITMTRKYPIQEEALKKMDSISNDPDLLSCKLQTEKKN